jgi:hypothetical protein
LAGCCGEGDGFAGWVEVERVLDEGFEGVGSHGECGVEDIRILE